MPNLPPDLFTIVPGKNDAGRPIFSVLVKRTYSLQAKPARIEPRPLLDADIYYDGGDPETTSVQFESELAVFKLATDVVLIGKAYVPGGKPVARLDATLAIGPARKTIRVVGDRRCQFRDKLAPTFTDPVPFTEMLLRYERAYGGKDGRSIPGLEFVYPRNPVGRGVVLKNLRETVHNLPLPNLEDPGEPLTPDRVVLDDPEKWNRQPLPQGFGYTARTAYPRCSFVGAIPPFVNIDEPMREEGLGLVPRNQILLARQFRLPGFDVRFHQGASLGLAVPYLNGDEPVRLSNLTPDGDLSFSLPGEKPAITLDVGAGAQNLSPVLHTVCLRADDKQFDLIWRGALEMTAEGMTTITKLAAQVR